MREEEERENTVLKKGVKEIAEHCDNKTKRDRQSIHTSKEHQLDASLGERHCFRTQLIAAASAVDLKNNRS